MNEAMTPAELAAECKVIADLLPPHREKSVSVSVYPGMDGERASVGVYPVGYSRSGEHFTGDTFSDAFGAAREWCSGYQERRRDEAARKLAEAQAELAALEVP